MSLHSKRVNEIVELAKALDRETTLKLGSVLIP